MPIGVRTVLLDSHPLLRYSYINRDPTRRCLVKRLFALAILSVILAALALSCGDGGSGTQSETGTVALYGTDSLAGYESVEAIINTVALVHTGSGDTCTVAEYQDVDITELSAVLEFLGAADCPARSYNRLRLVFEEDVVLTDGQDVTATCVFDTYKDSKGQPNKLFCEGGLCTVEINGAVNVLASSAGVTGLDFDLKEFEVVDFPDPSCAVTMKTSPVHASDMAGLPRVVKGIISELTDTTFLLTKGNDTFLVDYSGAAYEGTPQSDLGIAGLLALARDQHLLVRVSADAIDFTTDPYSVTRTRTRSRTRQPCSIST
jgi:hypothetical protein